MTIDEAKVQIKDTVIAYSERDQYGDHLIPSQSQRPVFLMGPPGIGKTAIMAEIANELDINLLSYSMTHHTRQSTLGLPIIKTKEYGGEETSVTEYTMSEIIASVYDEMEATGNRAGILFLDEMNCVSETLTPTMLQFLQYKTFGRHALPDGWVVVAAGNPPEYNRSAREFDMVTWDRLKRIDIDPDYLSWRKYAVSVGVHPAVLSYLDINRSAFYSLRRGEDGHGLVTARGWTDLSNILLVYEKKGLAANRNLIVQYLQDAAIADSFADYYMLFKKYDSDYRIQEILSGAVLQEIIERASAAPFDERLSLLELMLGKIREAASAFFERRSVLEELHPYLKAVKAGEPMQKQIEEEKSRLSKSRRRGGLSPQRRVVMNFTIAFLERNAGKDFSAIKESFESLRTETTTCAKAVSDKLAAIFSFCDLCWGEGQEMVILLSDLTADPLLSMFVARYGCDAYYKHSEVLMFNQRRNDIERAVTALQKKEQVAVNYDDLV